MRAFRLQAGVYYVEVGNPIFLMACRERHTNQHTALGYILNC